VDGPDVLTWFDLHITVAPRPTANSGCPSRTGRLPASAWPSTRAQSPAA